MLGRPAREKNSSQTSQMSSYSKTRSASGGAKRLKGGSAKSGGRQEAMAWPSGGGGAGGSGGGVPGCAYSDIQVRTYIH